MVILDLPKNNAATELCTMVSAPWDHTKQLFSGETAEAGLGMVGINEATPLWRNGGGHRPMRRGEVRHELDRAML